MRRPRRPRAPVTNPSPRRRRPPAIAGIPVAQPAPDQQQVIVGSGSADERRVIDDSNQRILDAEHAGSADGAASPSGVNQGIP
ncbi:MAG: hypothetical protein WDO13_10515 [Verrucomicrobiota bacterium]